MSQSRILRSDSVSNFGDDAGDKSRLKRQKSVHDDDGRKPRPVCLFPYYPSHTNNDIVGRAVSFDSDVLALCFRGDRCKTGLLEPIDMAMRALFMTMCMIANARGANMNAHTVFFAYPVTVERGHEPVVVATILFLVTDLAKFAKSVENSIAGVFGADKGVAKGPQDDEIVMGVDAIALGGADEEGGGVDIDLGESSEEEELYEGGGADEPDEYEDESVVESDDEEEEEEEEEETKTPDVDDSMLTEIEKKELDDLIIFSGGIESAPYPGQLALKMFGNSLVSYDDACEQGITGDHTKKTWRMHRNERLEVIREVYTARKNAVRDKARRTRDKERKQAKRAKARAFAHTKLVKAEARRIKEEERLEAKRFREAQWAENKRIKEEERLEAKRTREAEREQKKNESNVGSVIDDARLLNLLPLLDRLLDDVAMPSTNAFFGDIDTKDGNKLATELRRFLCGSVLRFARKADIRSGQLTSMLQRMGATIDGELFDDQEPVARVTPPLDSQVNGASLVSNKVMKPCAEAAYLRSVFSPQCAWQIAEAAITEYCAENKDCVIDGTADMRRRGRFTLGSIIDANGVIGFGVPCDGPSIDFKSAVMASISGCHSLNSLVPPEEARRAQAVAVHPGIALPLPGQSTINVRAEDVVARHMATVSSIPMFLNMFVCCTTTEASLLTGVPELAMTSDVRHREIPQSITQVCAIVERSRANKTMGEMTTEARDVLRSIVMGVNGSSVGKVIDVYESRLGMRGRATLPFVHHPATKNNVRDAAVLAVKVPTDHGLHELTMSDSIVCVLMMLLRHPGVENGREKVSLSMDQANVAIVLLLGAMDSTRVTRSAESLESLRFLSIVYGQAGSGKSAMTDAVFRDLCPRPMTEACNHVSALAVGKAGFCATRVYDEVGPKMIGGVDRDQGATEVGNNLKVVVSTGRFTRDIFKPELGNTVATSVVVQASFVMNTNMYPRQVNPEIRDRALEFYLLSHSRTPLNKSASDNLVERSIDRSEGRAVVRDCVAASMSVAVHDLLVLKGVSRVSNGAVAFASAILAVADRYGGNAVVSGGRAIQQLIMLARQLAVLTSSVAVASCLVDGPMQPGVTHDAAIALCAYTTPEHVESASSLMPFASTGIAGVASLAIRKYVGYWVPDIYMTAMHGHRLDDILRSYTVGSIWGNTVEIDARHARYSGMVRVKCDFVPLDDGDAKCSRGEWPKWCAPSAEKLSTETVAMVRAFVREQYGPDVPEFTNDHIRELMTKRPLACITSESGYSKMGTSAKREIPLLYVANGCMYFHSSLLDNSKGKIWVPVYTATVTSGVMGNTPPRQLVPYAPESRVLCVRSTYKYPVKFDDVGDPLGKSQNTHDARMRTLYAHRKYPNQRNLTGHPLALRELMMTYKSTPMPSATWWSERAIMYRRRDPGDLVYKYCENFVMRLMDLAEKVKPYDNAKDVLVQETFETWAMLFFVQAVIADAHTHAVYISEMGKLLYKAALCSNAERQERREVRCIRFMYAEVKRLIEIRM